MRKHLLAGAAIAAGLLVANSASAAIVFFSGFETPNIASGSFSIFASADGWNKLSGDGIEIQDHVAGNPAAGGGDQFVELDSNNNSSMGRVIAAAGNYSLDFLYSPRPGISSASNVINVYLDTVLLTSLTGVGGGSTSWSAHNLTFSSLAGQTLIFAADGPSDSLGGYVDNIQLSTAAVPEPATWAMMITGFGLAGSMLRRRRMVAAAI
jgi:hypothetical protein